MTTALLAPAQPHAEPTSDLQLATGTFTAPGQTSPALRWRGPVSLSASGDFHGEALLERGTAAGSWQPLHWPGGRPVILSAPGSTYALSSFHAEQHERVRLRCLSLAEGAMTWRLSAGAGR